jgi:type IV pilus assembly protein PilM
MGRYVGIDIGTSAVRGVEVVVRGGKASIVSAAEVPLAAGAMVNGLIGDAPAVVDALKRLRSAGKFKTKNAAVAIANNDLVVRALEVPYMPADEVALALEYELGDYVAVGSDDVLHDVHVLGEVTNAAGERQLKVLLAAGDEAMINRFTEALAAAGFRPSKVGPSALALVRAVGKAGDGAAEAIVDVGASKTTIIVHCEGQPLSTRTLVGVGGDLVTVALQKRYEWTRIDAESTKISLGLAVSPEALRAGPSVFGDWQDGQAAALGQHPAAATIGEVMGSIINRIRETIEQTAGTQPVQRVMLTGGASQMRGFAERLSSELQVAVEQARIGGLNGSGKSSLAKYGTALTVAAGIAAA